MLRRLLVYVNIFVFQRTGLCSDYWEKVVEDLELQSERKEILLKYYVILTEIDPNKVDPEDDDILRDIWID